jgi:hypothetical protein
MNKKEILAVKILSLSYISWSGLGFVRGVKHYNYKHKNNKYESSQTYLYLKSLGYGCYGFALYCNPILLPFTICKELYRLEVNIRNLENEKNSEFYNDIL